MTLPIGAKTSDNRPSPAVAGFSFIELILVMAILSSVVVLTAPRLSNFIYGQSLQTESRRFLALTQYAYSEAISRGEPYLLWIAPDSKRYGLRPQWWQEDEQEVQELWFEVDESIDIEVLPNRALSNGIAEIGFSPEGVIEWNEVRLIRLSRSNQPPVEIAVSLIGMKFVIVNDENRDTVLDWR